MPEAIKLALDEINACGRLNNKPTTGVLAIKN
jgi:hypothetical protein